MVPADLGGRAWKGLTAVRLKIIFSPALKVPQNTARNSQAIKGNNQNMFKNRYLNHYLVISRVKNLTPFAFPKHPGK